MSERMEDKQTGFAIRFIQQFNFEAVEAKQRDCRHAHRVVVGPLVICRECLFSYPVREVDLRTSDQLSDTDDAMK